MNQENFRVFSTRNDFKKLRWAVRQPGCTNRSLTACLHQGHLFCGSYFTLETAGTSAHRYAAYLAYLASKAPAMYVFDGITK